MHNFMKLEIWLRSVEFVVLIYKVVEKFPPDERFGLTSQLKRCSSSIPSNISEGAGRGTNPQFKHFLEMSMGSCNEAITQLTLAYKLKFISEEIQNELIDEANQIYRMILGFYNSLH